jgi:hypothetical protein
VRDSENQDTFGEVTAALLWDLPALRAGSKSARDFADAMRGEPQKWWEPTEYRADPLGRAAQAVAAERAGEPGRAQPIYEHLAADRDPASRLLGRMLLAWSEPTRDINSLAAASDAASEADVTDNVRAHLFAKVATFALDGEQVEMAQLALARARELAPEASRLRRALDVEAINAGVEVDRAKVLTTHVVTPPDDLVDLPWIDDAALAAARAGLDEELERASERMWSWTLRFGGTTPVAQAASAEIQATWAGALWLRRSLRRQLGAHLLGGEAEVAQQWAYGLVMWTLGDGKNPERLFELAEPHLDASGTDFVVRTSFECNWPQAAAYRTLALAEAAWDCISDDTLRWLIGRFEVQAGEHPLVRHVHGLWGTYALRLPNEWIEGFARQGRDVQRDLLARTGVDAVAALNDEGQRRAVLALVMDELQSEPVPDAQLLRLAATLATLPATHDELQALVAERARPDVVASLIDGRTSALVSEEVLLRARSALVEAVEATANEATEGKVSFGARDARLDLARVLTQLPPDREAIELLERVASDPGLPAEHLLAARNALALLRHRGKLSAQDVARWHDAPDPLGTFPEHGGASVELVAARRHQILARELTELEAVRVITGTRSTDKQVRLISIQTCGEAAEAGREPESREAFAWALVGALFDPLDDLAAAAVRALEFALTAGPSVTSDVALARLPRLYEIGNTTLREAVVHVAAAIDADAAGLLRPTLALAAADKSWRVRQIAAGASPGAD